ncbi:acetamidase/formamidase family protein [Frigoribacterium sp. CG_9.8]|uniref:acetamidase/formamidase family protein n=1 Tax=Frigoribacterium sp. CG_9.8 TaxID=2787733 RepID=UPI0018C9A8C3|nr:acetamidase/formamidase family protein [Frigoribacterium sp. CG_9.8]MBG6107996.1 acetamidase/formamidase [Frigoribacterium sp. CG_9.8]
MDFIEFTPNRSQYVYTFGGAEPVMRVKPGTALGLWSEDAFNHTLRSVDDLASAHLDVAYLNPQTGPFYIVGAKAGDTLAVHIVSLTPARSWGASATIPFFGGLTSTDRTALLHPALPEATWIYEVDTDAGTVGFQSRFGDFQVALPLAPMLGTVGVAPAGSEVRSSLVPERFGGNMDTPEMKAGTTAYFGVNVDGALLSIGDGHYRQGEGEACGTAVEGAMNSVIIVELITGGGPLWPRLENDDYWMVVGSSRPMEDSWRIAQLEMTRWMSEMFDLHEMDAYQLLSQITETPIANVVDTNYSVVVKVPKKYFTRGKAFDGMHRELRDRASRI